MAQAWPRPPRRIDAGTVTANSTTLTAVAFTSGTFIAPPIVVATVVQTRVPVTVQDITASGFNVIHDGTGNRSVNWVAIQP